MQLEFLRPGVFVGHTGPKLFDIDVQALLYRLVDIDVMLGKPVVQGGHQLVEFVALAIWGADNADLVTAPCSNGEGRTPDPAAVRMEREFIKQHIAAETTGGIRRGGNRSNTRAARKAHLLGFVLGFLNVDQVGVTILDHFPLVGGDNEILF